MPQELTLETELRVDRRRRDRRDSKTPTDRRVVSTRKRDATEEVEQRKEPRRKVERRRMIDPTTCERDYSGDEIEFMKAMDDYKRKSGRQFPTWSEVLEVIRGLGYTRPTSPITESSETAASPELTTAALQ